MITPLGKLHCHVWKHRGFLTRFYGNISLINHLTVAGQKAEGRLEGDHDCFREKMILGTFPLELKMMWKNQNKLHEL